MLVVMQMVIANVGRILKELGVTVAEKGSTISLFVKVM